MYVIIDNGHGSNTAGKRSPDKSLYEWKWNREITSELVKQLKAAGIACELLVTEEQDISLAARCTRANNICKQHGGAGKCILISIHSNAAGSKGEWMLAGGWSAYTTRGITKADALATKLYKAAEECLKDYMQIMAEGKKQGKYSAAQKPFRKDYSDGDPDHEAGFYILQHTACPAVLTESLFYDNKTDVQYLLSSNGKANIVKLHLEGIKAYIKSVEGK